MIDVFCIIIELLSFFFEKPAKFSFQKIPMEIESLSNQNSHFDLKD